MTAAGDDLTGEPTFTFINEASPDTFVPVPPGAPSLWVIFNRAAEATTRDLMLLGGAGRLLWLATSADPHSRVHAHRRSFGQYAPLASRVRVRMTLEPGDDTVVYADAAEVDEPSLGRAVAISCHEEHRTSTAILWPPAGRPIPSSVWTLLLATWVQARLGGLEEPRYTLLRSLLAEVFHANVLLWLPLSVVETGLFGAVLFGERERLSSLAAKLESRARRVDSLEGHWAQGLVISLTG